MLDKGDMKMSDYDQLHYCTTCQDTAMFNMSGSGNNGTCMECETEYENNKQLELLRRAVYNKYLRDKIVFDRVFTLLKRRKE